MKPEGGKISVQLLVDRPMLEICGNDGRVFITLPREERGEVKTIDVRAEGGAAKLLSLDVYELKSIWRPQRTASK